MRTVDHTGLVWQQGPHGEKIIGEIHTTRAGRFYVNMTGRRITEKSLVTFEEAKQAALDWQPNTEDQQVLADILDPMGVAQ